MVEVSSNPNMANRHCRYFCVVPAAGIGARMQAGQPKSYLKLCGQSIFAITLTKLLQLDWLETIIVVVAEDDRLWQQEALVSHPKIQIVPGGAERYLSVLNGIRALDNIAQSNDWVLVHDIARPCFLVSDVEHLKEKLCHSLSGGLLATPVKETLKRVNHQNDVVETVSREGVWAALTPQMFRYALLYDALKLALDQQHPVTDESDAIERLGSNSVVVPGNADNIKVTFPEDLVRAERILMDNKS